MPFVPLASLLPDLAAQETRTLTLLQDGEIPAGIYFFDEFYCNEPRCDCRRVFFSVRSEARGKPEAVIAYGWESSRFYARWLGQEDPQLIKELKGPILNRLSPQSPRAPALLKLIKDIILTEEAYVKRLKVHYRLFRQLIEKNREPFASKHRRKKPAKRGKGFPAK